MKKHLFLLFFCLIACNQKLADHVCENATFRVMRGAKAGAAFVNIRNANDHVDSLESATCAWAGRIELHDHIVENNTARMIAVQSLEIPAKSKASMGVLELKRGGKHLMLFDLNPKIFDQQEIEIELVFKNSAPQKVKFARDS